MSKCGFNSTTIHNPETQLSHQVLLACERGKFEHFEEYLEKNKGIDINEQDSNGSTALHFAVAQSNVKCLGILFKYNANTNIKDENGFTPLALAAGRYANSSVSETLLNKGAEVNIVNKYGNSLLHTAVYAQDIHCVQILMKHGADITIQNKKGKTPLDLAKKLDNEDIIAVIRTSTNLMCAHCSQKPKTGLKKCTGCKAAQYCSKICQKLDWKYGHKQICSGYVLTTLVVKQADPTEILRLSKKKFIVKVQIELAWPGNPQVSATENMMVYNKDKKFIHFIFSNSQEKVCKMLVEKIQNEGFMGVKAFFWAEFDANLNNRVKIFYREMTSFQDW
ncbi:hypothetical protein SNE40_014076 [Patella caerulea]|uniref:MYND-type domain-containing protein n=1 Tax=Patella caerulea TaxID=87958 RepID=A0AAN8JKJ4_PATCE